MLFFIPEILSVAEKLLPQINLVSTVPGITAFATVSIIGEIGADMSVFETSRHLCSWAGLTPQNDQSVKGILCLILLFSYGY